MEILLRGTFIYPNLLYYYYYCYYYNKHRFKEHLHQPETDPRCFELFSHFPLVPDSKMRRQSLARWISDIIRLQQVEEVEEVEVTHTRWPTTNRKEKRVGGRDRVFFFYFLLQFAHLASAARYLTKINGLARRGVCPSFQRQLLSRNCGSGTGATLAIASRHVRCALDQKVRTVHGGTLTKPE